MNCFLFSNIFSDLKKLKALNSPNVSKEKILSIIFINNKFLTLVSEDQNEDINNEWRELNH